MITYDKDGATLIDGDGKRVTIWDQPRYGDLEAILDLQEAALNENAHAVDLYNTSLKNEQISVDAGRPADAPQKPLKHVISDTGVSSYVPFVPPLADLVQLPPSIPSGGIAAPSVDKQAIAYAQINAIYKKLVLGQ